MEQIKFNDYLDYFRTKLEALASDLYDEELITRLYTFEMFKDYAKYYKQTELPYTLNEEEDTPVLVLLKNDGILNDPSISIETSLQSINFEFIYTEEYQEDISYLINTFIETYKSSIDSFGTNTVVLNISDGASYNRLKMHADLKMKADFSINIVIFKDAIFSNSVSLYMNNMLVPNSLVNIHRTTDLKPDLKKTNDTVWYPSTSILTVTVKGIYINNTEIEEIIEDCATASNFKRLTSLNIYKYKGEDNQKEILSDNFYIKDSDVQFLYGSLSAFEVTFYKGVNL